ncbi:hypothetical protein FG93_05404 [Bosea sp. LC85]|uniref:hypothetical protein n=1 Tax=Bosea sp. LC85 TaxID=1502851 RepID=UPI0004E399E4|nr:hypothetical protein [Bosea sp. LC85]KFC63895.1 hypothetical protein FG93_05404 [Bosea sp. LC85]
MTPEEKLIAEADDIENAIQIAVDAAKQSSIPIETRIAQLERWVVTLMLERAKDLRKMAAAAGDKGNG